MIDCRINGFLALPPSRFGGADYRWFPNEQITEAPGALIAHCADTARTKTYQVKAGSYDFARFAVAVLKANAAGAYDDRDDHLTSDLFSRPSGAMLPAIYTIKSPFPALRTMMRSGGPMPTITVRVRKQSSQHSSISSVSA